MLSVATAERVGVLPVQQAQQLLTVQSKALQRDIAAALATLPENQRTALILLRFDGMTYVEIADAMQTTIPAIKGLLNRAKRHLMTELATHIRDTPIGNKGIS